MKRFFQKTAFVVLTLGLWMIFEVAALVATETSFPIRRGPDGLYPSVDRTGLSVITVALTAWSANWVASTIFKIARISRDRWSLLRSPRFWD